MRNKIMNWRARKQERKKAYFPKLIMINKLKV